MGISAGHIATGTEGVLSGGVAISTIVSGGATQVLASGGVASFILVSNQGFQSVLSDGVASRTVVRLGGAKVV
jgi:antigen 43